MKCSNCNQEFIDIKDFCPNCGKLVKVEKKTVSKKTIIIVIIVLILVGALVIYSIMHLGLESELKPYLDR